MAHTLAAAPPAPRREPSSSSMGPPPTLPPPGLALSKPRGVPLTFVGVARSTASEQPSGPPRASPRCASRPLSQQVEPLSRSYNAGLSPQVLSYDSNPPCAQQLPSLEANVRNYGERVCDSAVWLRAQEERRRLCAGVESPPPFETEG